MHRRRTNPLDAMDEERINYVYNNESAFMALKNTTQQWGWLAKTLHWVIGFTIIAMIGVGWYMKRMDYTPEKWEVYGIHKATGIAVLALVLIRLLWRLANITPLLPADISPMQKGAAQASHFCLYILMLAMPLTGWLMSSAGGHEVSFYGLFTVPHLIGHNPEFGKLLNQTHTLLAWILVGLLVVHIAAALYHHCIRKDGVLRRMLPSCPVKCHKKQA